MPKRPALGRGLESLFPDGLDLSPAPEERSPTGGESGQIQYLPIADIDTGRLQPRTAFDEGAITELVQSIREQGILQPLIVRRKESGFELIAGERRLRAATTLNFDVVPAIIRDVSDREALELSLVENIQREALNAIELASAFRQLQEQFGYTQEEISARVGKDRSTITNHVRLLKLPDEAKKELAAGRISMGHARALLGLETSGLIFNALGQVLERGLSVRDTERLVKRLKRAKARTKEPSAPTTEETEVSERLRRTFQTQVQILTRKNGKGEIRIEYYSLDDLNRILELMPEACK